MKPADYLRRMAPTQSHADRKAFFAAADVLDRKDLEKHAEDQIIGLIPETEEERQRWIDALADQASRAATQPEYVCGTCGRRSVGVKYGSACAMRQPNGSECPGTFRVL